MLRFRENDLSNWFNQRPRKPLILRGARQVGKTTLVSQFATKSGLVLHEINLERHGTLRNSVDSLDVDSFLRDVQLISKKGSLASSNSLLFIDEIQAIPKALTLLRYLYEERKELAVLAAGSLLEFALADEHKHFSMPVGRVEYLFLGPVTFEEFLAALGQGELIKVIKEYQLGQTFSFTAHKQLLEMLRVYLLVGGMPEAISTFLHQDDLERVAKVQATILDTYREDFSKYAKKNQLNKLQKIFDYIPVGIGKKVKYVNIDRDSKSADIKQALKLLEMANVLPCAYATDAVKPPLGAMKNFEVYKPYFLDCGLVNRLSDSNLVPTDLKDLFLNGGSLAEQFIGQHLAYSGKMYSPPTLFYWLREGKSNNAEVDFLVSHSSHVVPVEVKSGTSGTLKSLHQFVDRAECSLAVRFDLNIPSLQKMEVKLTTVEKRESSSELLSLPLYMVGELTRLVGEVLNR